MPRHDAYRNKGVTGVFRSFLRDDRRLQRGVQVQGCLRPSSISGAANQYTTSPPPYLSIEIASQFGICEICQMAGLSIQNCDTILHDRKYIQRDKTCLNPTCSIIVFFITRRIRTGAEKRWSCVRNDPRGEKDGSQLEGRMVASGWVMHAHTHTSLGKQPAGTWF